MDFRVADCGRGVCVEEGRLALIAAALNFAVGMRNGCLHAGQASFLSASFDEIFNDLPHLHLTRSAMINPQGGHPTAQAQAHAREEN